MKLQIIILMGLCVLFNSGAHIIIKYSTRLVDGFWARNINPLGGPHIPVLFLAGALSFAISIVFYLLVLKSAQLSIAFSVLTSMNYVIIILYSVLCFRDQLKLTQYFGLVLIFIGLFLLLYNFSEKKAPASDVQPKPEQESHGVSP